MVLMFPRGSLDLALIWWSRALSCSVLSGLALSGLVLSCCGPLVAQASRPQATGSPPDSRPATAAEASQFRRTSTLRDVDAFLNALQRLPAASRLQRLPFFVSDEGRATPLVIASEPVFDRTELATDSRLRILVCANIHGGEVEGKEAIQILLREIAQGMHADLLRHAVLIFVPIYNVDGNERISPRHRVEQNGPDAGVGQRETTAGLDLNRDFVKCACRETIALLSLWNRYDPHLFLDLHTTNGSPHGYHLTYAPCLSPNQDADLRSFCRGTLLPAVRQAMAGLGFQTFDYGNFVKDNAKSGRDRTWQTYDHRPRFGTNLFGLRQRLAILSEAYSYLDFAGRIQVTRAFVLECVRAASQSRAKIRALCTAADQRALAGALQFPFATTFEPARAGEILVSRLDQRRIGDIGTRYLRRQEATPQPMQLQTDFVASRQRSLPRAYAVRNPSQNLLTLLAYHGVEGRTLDQPNKAEVEVFRIDDLRRKSRPFQRRYEVTLRGTLRSENVVVPTGTLIVSTRQRLARVAAQLLEPESEDSLSTWDVFATQLEPIAGKLPDHPVWRVKSGCD